MTKLNLTLILFFLISTSMQAQQMFQNYLGQDIGNPKQKGSFRFDENKQKFTLSGSGYNMRFECDEFYMVLQKIEGDFIISANLKFLDEGVDVHRKIGLIIRNSDEENAILHGRSSS